MVCYILMKNIFVVKTIFVIRTLGAIGASTLLGAAAADASPFSDQFNGTTLNPGWTVTSPNPASSVALDGSGHLVITASYQNGGSDLFTGSNYNAPVILQSVDPNANYTITTSLSFNPTNNYQGAGILLATTTSPFTSALQFNRIVERAFYPNGGGSIVEGAGGSNAYSSGTIYLEVSKVGNVYTSAYSSNGINWTTLGSETNTTAYTEIGLFTLRQPWDGVALDSVASFDSFNVTSAVPEPSTWAMMILGLCGLGLLAARRRQPIGIAAD